MNWYFAAAGMLSLIIGLVHSVLGELLIFRRMRAGGVVPTNGGPVLREPHVRIVWATWHVVTVLGGCVAAVLLWLALGSPAAALARGGLVAHAISVAMLVSSLLVLIGTKGKHPGWVGLLGVALLTAVGAYA
jgi:hypothetical protein